MRTFISSPQPHPPICHTHGMAVCHHLQHCAHDASRLLLRVGHQCMRQLEVQVTTCGPTCCQQSQQELEPRQVLRVSAPCCDNPTSPYGGQSPYRHWLAVMLCAAPSITSRTCAQLLHNVQVALILKHAHDLHDVGVPTQVAHDLSLQPAARVRTTCVTGSPRARSRWCQAATPINLVDAVIA